MRRLVLAVCIALVASIAPAVPGASLPRVHTWAVEVTSGTIRAQAPFTLLGVTWPARFDTAGEIEVRVRTGGRWGAWTELHADDEEGPDAGVEGRGVRGTTPLWVRSARDVQVRGAPRGARLRLVDPGEDRPVRGARASPGMPGVISRAGWGADESKRRAGPAYANELRAAFVHHTATGNAYGPGDSARIVRSIYAYHVDGRGWNDIGYNFLVDRFGQVFEGRAGGIDRPVIGAHAQGFNTGSTGVSLIGTFSGVRPPQATVSAATALLSWKLDRHFVDPYGTTTMVSGGSNRWAEGTAVTLRAISGHRDVGHTDCPGDGVYAIFEQLRRGAAVHGDPKLYEPRLVNGVFVPDGTEATLSGRFSSEVTWEVEVVGVRRAGGWGNGLHAGWDGRTQDGFIAPPGDYTMRLHGSNANGPVRTVDFPIRLRPPPRYVVSIARSTGGLGRWHAWSDAALDATGVAPALGTGPVPLRAPVSGAAATTSGRGVWLSTEDGRVLAFGDAQTFGDARGVSAAPVSGIAGALGAGYWLVARDGGVFTFGAASFHGSAAGVSAHPVVGIAPAPSADGYRLVARDGGVFTFGAASFHGSAAGISAQSVVAIVATPTGGGYWLLGRDGGVFSFGDATFHGSAAGRTSAPATGIAATATGLGYTIVAADGTTYPFGDATIFDLA